MSGSMEGKEVRENLRKAIDDYCKWRVNNHWCGSDQCEYCALNQSYEMACEPSMLEDLKENI